MLKTYNKDKPEKYGLNIRSLRSSRRPYFYYTIPYTGKPVEMTDTHIKDTSLLQRLVGGYEEHRYSLEGTNIRQQEWQVNPVSDMAVWKNVTCVGTILMNRKGLSIEIKETKDREEFSWMSRKEDNDPVILNSYDVNTKSTGKRKVLLLQTTKLLLMLKKMQKRPHDMQAIWLYQRVCTHVSLSPANGQ